jgi:hypothetical protein
MPMVGGGAGVRVEVEDFGIILGNRQGGVSAGERSQARGEADLLCRTDPLVPKEHHPMVEQGLTDGDDILVPQPAEVDTRDLCAGADGHTPYGQAGPGGGAHGFTPNLMFPIIYL